MKRRAFLGVLTRGIAGGLLVGDRAAAWAQTAMTPGATAPKGPPEAATASAPGVTPKELKIGMSAAFKGTAAGLGTEFYRGAQAYYQEVNAKGGVHGRSITVVALDDGYEPIPCIKNTIQLVEKEGAFFLSNYVGTPTLTRALPVIKRYGDVILVGNFTGAQPQREAPYVEHVFNIRASYRQEMMALVERFWQQGARRFGVYYQIDAYGRSGTDGVARGLALKGAKIAAEATYQRGAKFEDDMTPAAKALREAGVDVVLCTGAYQGCGAFVKSARDLGWNVPISNVSFVGSDAMLSLLVKHGQTTGRDYTRALVNSQVVPSYDDLSLPGVAEYRALMDKYSPGVPEALRDPKYPPQRLSFISLEGFVNAKVIVEGLRRAGVNPTRAGLRQAFESIRNFDLGVGAPLAFGPERHQGLDNVYFTRVDNGRWAPIADWGAAVRA
ncbi:MAG TPA: ABC transporter substrate-binding protein [Methylomirabilota bacterium]|jgi:ABC-type branched-subunit amino acid transport system substrate-binding protein|nr:ABC transporter substrate-binding protein [Methylomirabilota bacterium]